jgi:hypothetical protein
MVSPSDYDYHFRSEGIHSIALRERSAIVTAIEPFSVITKLSHSLLHALFEEGAIHATGHHIVIRTLDIQYRVPTERQTFKEEIGDQSTFVCEENRLGMSHPEIQARKQYWIPLEEGLEIMLYALFRVNQFFEFSESFIRNLRINCINRL